MRTSANLFSNDNQPTERFEHLLKNLRLPYGTLEEIDDGLQTAFFQKKDNGEAKERWELARVTVECPEYKIRDQLGGLGFLFKTQPRQMRYDRAGWPGALVTRAAGRLVDLIQAWQDGIRWNETIVFGGKRALLSDRESRAACINTLQDAPHLMAGMPTSELILEWDRLGPTTELDLMKWIWACSKVPSELRNVPIVFVDAPMKPSATPGGKEVRPSTEDTITAWNNQYSPTPGSLLVSSGAPYGMAQNEAFWMLLGPKGHSIETFGHAVPEGLGLEVVLRELAGCVNRIRRARDV